MSQAVQRQAHGPVVAPPAWFPPLPRRSSSSPRVGGHTVGENRAARSPPLSARRHFVLPCHPHLASAGTPLRRPHRALPHPSALRRQLCWPCVSRKKRSLRHHRRPFLPRSLRRFHPPLAPAVTPLASTAPLLSPPLSGLLHLLLHLSPTSCVGGDAVGGNLAALSRPRFCCALGMGESCVPYKMVVGLAAFSGDAVGP